MSYLHKAKSMKGLATWLMNIYGISESSRINILGVTDKATPDYVQVHEDKLCKELKHYRKEIKRLSK